MSGVAVVAVRLNFEAIILLIRLEDVKEVKVECLIGCRGGTWTERESRASIS